MDDLTTVATSQASSLDPITDDVRNVMLLVNLVIICGVISMFGIGANITIMLVFVRQGFKDSINISLLGLAVSDLACSVTMFWTSICNNPLFHSLDLPIAPLEVMYATGAWPHVCFNRITSFITAFITLERCLCISMPLQIKNIITPFRTKVIIFIIFSITIILFVPFYFVNKLDWVFSLSRNISILGLTFTRDKDQVESITFFIHSVFLSSTLLISVHVCTIILVVKLNYKTKWRKTIVTQSASKRGTESVKEKKVVKMVVLISTIFIVCYIMPTVNFLLMALYPEFSVSGRFKNLLLVDGSVAFILEAVNSSVNIFVYIKMSSKFKVTLKEIVCVWAFFK